MAHLECVTLTFQLSVSLGIDWEHLPGQDSGSVNLHDDGVRRDWWTWFFAQEINGGLSPSLKR